MAAAARVRTLTRYLRTYHLAPHYTAAVPARVIAGDGTVLAAHRLPGPPQSPCTVVVLHGLAHWSRSPSVHAFASELAKRFEVIVPDMRGHGRSRGMCTLGGAEADDLQTVLDELVDAGRPVVTVGASLGAAVVLLHAARFGGVAGVVAVSPPARWGGLDTRGARRIELWSSSRWRRKTLEVAMRTRIAAVPAVHPGAVAVGAAIREPFVIVASDPDDDFFPREHAEEIYASLASPAKELWWLPGWGHGIDLLTRGFAARVGAAVEARLSSASRPRPQDRRRSSPSP